jgi:hypothetical protein
MIHLSPSIACRFAVLALLASSVAGCSGDEPTGPSQGAYVTFRVVDEVFRVHITDESQVEAARRAEDGGKASIPNGRIVAGSGVNLGWTWHLEDVEFAETAIELCDGRPSDVERQGVAFGGGRFCPWSARVIDILED